MKVDSNFSVDMVESGRFSGLRFRFGCRSTGILKPSRAELQAALRSMAPLDARQASDPYHNRNLIFGP